MWNDELLERKEMILDAPKEVCAVWFLITILSGGKYRIKDMCSI